MPRNPLNAVPATRSSLPTQRIRRRAVLGALTAAALTGPVSVLLVANHKDPVPPVVQLPDQSAISLAQTVVTDYFAARKSAVPTAKDVSDDFSQVSGLDSSSTAKPLEVQSIALTSSVPSTLGDNRDGTATQVTEQETFAVSVNSKLYNVTVTMVRSGYKWVLGAAPAILPATTGGGGQQALDYKSLYSGGGDESLLPNRNYAARVQQWATTFAQAGHADEDLLAITGDQGGRTYSGLGGWSLVGTPEITSVVKVDRSSYGPAGFIVRTSLVLRAPAANGPTLSTSYDLYIESDKSASLPPVVAWAPAGSYRTLTPHMNADQQ